MERTRGFSFARHYLRAHLWLRHRCDRLTARQRKLIVFSLSFVYLVCSLVMIAQFFLPQKEELPIPAGRLMDSPIRKDSVSQGFYEKQYQPYYTTINENG